MDRLIDEKAARALEEKFDAEIRFRPLSQPAQLLVGLALFVLSAFHTYTAGFGLLEETLHRGVHMSFVLALIFLVFARRGASADRRPVSGWIAPGGVPLYDWALAVIAIGVVLYVPWIFDDLAFLVGNPRPQDVIAGTLLIAIAIEATRRTMGWPLPIIAISFMLYALFGRVAPGVLVHPGTSWSGLVNHLYLTTQGIYGLPLGVVSTYVFHFVLFGVLATRIGLGQLFIDLASWAAGRYAGGPAKVSIFGSALFGMISGSSIANTVTVGSLTIPAMIRVGYKRHFAAAVEATASTGGQITPPVMGAAAFLMIEFLGVPYQTIILAAIVPAAMHFFGVFMQVHFEAKRNGLRGLSPEELPDPRRVLRDGWMTVFPLIALVAILLSGFTPYLAAFWGIVGCVIVGVLNPRKRLGLADLYDGFVTGAKYALAVGAAAATVGIVVGVVTLTGVGFKVSFIVTTGAKSVTEWLLPLIPFGLASAQGLTLFLTLVLTAIVCILMGCGIPTTANYIIMVTVAAPTLGVLGVAPIVAHFFVFYYGVLADITPPVALAAYAGASLANADPFKTGNTAFRLGLAKALVPFVFVFSPSLLLVAPGFDWTDFTITLLGCVLGIVCLAAALSDFFLVRMQLWERLLGVAAALLLIAPSLRSTLIGLALVTPIVLRHLIARRRVASTAPSA
jgi:TRAP transporter 4TM/12TM fusion protein